MFPPVLRGALVAAISALVSVGTDAGAQQPARHSARPVVVRVGAMRGVPVCLCNAAGQPAPRDRDLVVASLGTEWALAGADGPFRLSYEAALLPLVLSQNTADDGLSIWSCGVRHYCGQSSTEYPWNTASVGVGVLPIGFVARARAGDAFAMRARLSGGAVYMSRPVPVMQSRNLNFIAELAVGAELHVRHGLAMSAGVTQNHISNGNRAPVNLGMDTRLLELGLVFAR